MSRTITGWRGDTWIACDGQAVTVLYGVEDLTRPVPLCPLHSSRILKPTWRTDNLWRPALPGELCCQPKEGS